MGEPPGSMLFDGGSVREARRPGYQDSCMPTLPPVLAPVVATPPDSVTRPKSVRARTPATLKPKAL